MLSTTRYTYPLQHQNIVNHMHEEVRRDEDFSQRKTVFVKQILTIFKITYLDIFPLSNKKNVQMRDQNIWVCFPKIIILNSFIRF